MYISFFNVQIWCMGFIFFFILFLNLKHCISFAKHQNESATGIHVFLMYTFSYICS